MKAKVSFQWIMRAFLILVMVINIFSSPNNSVSAKPLLGTFTDCASQTQIPAAECNALVALYNSTNSAGWTTKTDWLQKDTPCAWYGITCMVNPVVPTLYNVIGLYLSDNNLVGSIPMQLGSLTNLGSLVLSGNQLSGSIPPELGNLTNLEILDLSDNHLSGSIPPELGSLIRLWGLCLNNNQLSGSIPTQLGNLVQLNLMYLDHNHLSGAFPASITNLVNLKYLTFDCGLTSTNPVVIAFINGLVPDWQTRCLKNGGFETYSGTSKIPANWTQSKFSTLDGKNTIHKTGKYSVKITGAAGKTKTLTQTLSFSGANGNAFTFSYWVQAYKFPAAGLCQAQVLFYNGVTPAGTKTLKCPVGVTYAWTQAKSSFTAPAAYTKVVIKFTFSKASGTVWFDLVSLLR